MKCLFLSDVFLSAPSSLLKLTIKVFSVDQAAERYKTPLKSVTLESNDNGTLFLSY